MFIDLEQCKSKLSPATEFQKEHKLQNPLKFQLKKRKFYFWLFKLKSLNWHYKLRASFSSSWVPSSFWLESCGLFLSGTCCWPFMSTQNSRMELPGCFPLRSLREETRHCRGEIRAWQDELGSQQASRPATRRRGALRRCRIVLRRHPC